MADARLHPWPDAGVAPGRHDVAMGKLDGRVVAITGASRGLGRALALAVAADGASIAICARDSAALERVAAAAREHGGVVVAVSADIADPRDIERFAATTLDRIGVPDVLVNNASALGPVPLPHVLDASPDGLRELLEVNLVGPLRLTQALAGGMILRGSGLILNLTSDAAVSGYPGWGLYSASKAALEALTRSLAAELEGSGVRALSVDPGDMDTDMHRAAIPDADPSELLRPDTVAARLVAMIAGPIPTHDRVEVSSL